MRHTAAFVSVRRTPEGGNVLVHQLVTGGKICVCLKCTRTPRTCLSTSQNLEAPV